MGTLRKVLLLGLPGSLEKALQEQFSREEDLAVESACGPETSAGIFDLIIHKNSALPAAARPGVPLLPIEAGRRERLGTLLRKALQMMEEPSLWLSDFALGPYLFRPAEKILARQGGPDIALTDKETDILVFLARQAGHPVSREALLKNVWRYHESADTHTLETHIYRLRQKIEEKAEEPGLLVTVEGGYTLYVGQTEKDA